MTDVTPGIGFVGVAPCRLVDTRQAGFPAGYGTPALAAGVPRNFDLNSDPLCTGIPAGVDAYSLNITATNTQGPGFILIYPQGGAQPPVSTLNYLANETVANAAIVPAGINGGVTVIAGVSGTNLIIDINGYFADTLGNNQFEVRSGGGVAIFGENTGSGYGVWGISATGYGVVGGGGAGGVWATTSGPQASGVFGQHTGSGNGVLGWTQTGVGVFGRALATAPFSPPNYGVWGQVDSQSNASAGVFGVDGGGVNAAHSFHQSAGVRGEARNNFGVLGISENTIGVGGIAVNSANGAILAAGYLGFNGAFGDYGVYSGDDAKVVGDLSVDGNFSSANKWFVEPHPHDASKEIRYVSLEGPHAEVYFRGTSQISRGITRIAIPEDFRFVADPGTYSTLVTPVGGMATVAVLSEGEAGVVVQASRDVKIHYVVYAERAAVKNPEPIVDNVHFRPEDERNAFAHIPDSYRRLLIQNGTLNPDGTVNMETARRLGWDKQWEKRERPSPQPTPE
jgi:hypothetical protein